MNLANARVVMKLKKCLKELLKRKLKSKYLEESFATYEHYLSWISQVTITHQKIQKWETWQTIFQYQVLMEDHKKVQNFSKGDIKANVVEMIA